jgi:uncharacterized protein (DUF2237 family)
MATQQESGLACRSSVTVSHTTGAIIQHVNKRMITVAVLQARSQSRLQTFSHSALVGLDVVLDAPSQHERIVAGVAPRDRRAFPVGRWKPASGTDKGVVPEAVVVARAARRTRVEVAHEIVLGFVVARLFDVLHI